MSVKAELENHRSCTALILTGTCGSGKTTISTLLAERHGWKRISEDETWKQNFGKNRGTFGTDEHRRKRQHVHQIVFSQVLSAHREARSVVIDATVHESPPEAYHEYQEFFEKHNIEWRIYVLHPRLEVAVARDSTRRDWIAGPERVERLRAKFSGSIFGAESFIDNSDETPEQTVSRILAACISSTNHSSQSA